MANEAMRSKRMVVDHLYYEEGCRKVTFRNPTTIEITAYVNEIRGLLYYINIVHDDEELRSKSEYHSVRSYGDTPDKAVENLAKLIATDWNDYVNIWLVDMLTEDDNNYREYLLSIVDHIEPEAIRGE